MVYSIFEFIFFVIIVSFCFYTGEFILLILTLGKKNVRWDLYTGEEDNRKYIFLKGISVLIGTIFWVSFIIYVF